MFSFIPPKQKKALLTEYKIRFTTVLFFALSVVFLIGFISELPAYFFSISEMRESLAKADVINKENEKSAKMYLEEIAHTNYFIDAYNSTTTDPTIYDSINSILKYKGGIIFNTFVIDRAKAPEDLFTVRGTAPKRETLVEFTKLLRTDKRFNGVSIPASEYVKSKDIVFNITIPGDY